MRIQSNLGSDIAMAFDECIEIPSPRKYVEDSIHRTYRWLERCKIALNAYNQEDDAVNPGQMLFGINQGATFPDLRVEHMKMISELDLPGYAIGGLAVGETHQEMYDTIEVVEEHMPNNKPRYLMGVGTPANLLEGIERGIDMFDCVMPTRNGRNACLFTSEGIMNMRNRKWADDFSPIDPQGTASVDHFYSKAYLHHLFKAQELLALEIASIHNLAFYLWLVGEARKHIIAGDFSEWKSIMIRRVTNRL
jgi:queuine tRNA-ribosyltransferase